MSSSVGYSYSYVDVEAQARRALRAEIAGYIGRARLVRAQAAGLKGARRAVAAGKLGRPAASATSTELAALAAQYRERVEAAERDLATLVTDTWAARLAAPAAESAGSGSCAALSCGAAGSAASPQAVPASPARLAGAGQLRAAGQLLARELPRCDPADLGLLDGYLAQLRAASRPDLGQRALAELEQAVLTSVERRKQAERVAELRESLLALADDALPEDRDRLRATIEETPDPGGLAVMVGRVVARADAARAREAVARAAAAALAEIGCDVGPDFAALLSITNEAVVPFGDGWAPGYGLLLRMPGGRDQIQAAVVRRAGADDAGDGGVQLQRAFCQELPGLLAGLDSRGVRLGDERRMEPGRAPVAAIAPDRWPTAATAAPARAVRRTARPATARAQAERQRER